MYTVFNLQDIAVSVIYTHEPNSPWFGLLTKTELPRGLLLKVIAVTACPKRYALFTPASAIQFVWKHAGNEGILFSPLFYQSGVVKCFLKLVWDPQKTVIRGSKYLPSSRRNIAWFKRAVPCKALEDTVLSGMPLFSLLLL